MARLLITGCGCVRLIYTTLSIVDWYKLPDGPNYVDGLRLSNTADAPIATIATSFLSVSALLEYLNSTFVDDNDLDGIFYPDGTYSNPEGFEFAEIFMTYGTTHLVCPVGDNPPQLTEGTEADITFPAGSTFSHPAFKNMAVVQVRVGSIDAQPISEGYTYTEVDPDNSANGLFSFPYTVDNEIIYFTLTQKPGA